MFIYATPYCIPNMRNFHGRIAKYVNENRCKQGMARCYGTWPLEFGCRPDRTIFYTSHHETATCLNLSNTTTINRSKPRHKFDRRMPPVEMLPHSRFWDLAAYTCTSHLILTSLSLAISFGFTLLMSFVTSSWDFNFSFKENYLAIITGL